MGLEGLGRDLVRGDGEDQRVGVLTLDVLCGQVPWPADIDTGNLVFVCALWHKEAHL